ncbi:DUF1345 domain-containing protein [Methylobacterium planeticum]|uniref:DUF1345 domain-containing protein n=1 Tax=Methylobacterium planeticum TaxID=2615211 RepID=A0A6N6MV92_9HYPH|nr:DUF1345 domain-containing protein [Methylobacterium planeticum]KAB1075484.1 DUF1345 domain-containing protein [Methylobacterium planeticum]
MTNPLRAFWLRPRLLGCIVLAILLTLALPVASLWSRLLLGWCVGVVAYIALVVTRAARQPRDALRDEASRLDDSALAVSLFAILSTAASFGAVAMLVFGEREKDGYQFAHLALASATMICAWAFVQTVFAIHYAHLYYGEAGAGQGRGGLDFNGDDDPDFWDFLYFSVTIGATSQTSDTDITSKTMRRIATVQTIYAYFFNTSVLALAINMAAGFAQH